MSKFLIEDRPTLTCMIQARTPERVSELIKRVLTAEQTHLQFKLTSLKENTAPRAVTECFLKKWAASLFMLPITVII